jgi:hypothetical protein
MFGCLGLCAGFMLCYVFFVIPTCGAKATAITPLPQRVFYVPKSDHSQLDWRPYLIQPMLPPKIIGRYEYNGR